MDKITCNLCGGTEFYKEAGFYYCNECQTQTQDIREQAEESEYPSQRVGRKLKGKGKPSEEQHATSWECYNYILKGLVNELVELGASPDLKSIVRILWFKYLEQIEFFTEDPADPPKLAAVYSQTDAELVYGRKPNRRSRSRSPASSSDVTSTDTSIRQRERKRQKRALVRAEYEEFASTQLSEEITSLHNQSLSSLKGSTDQTTKKVNLQFNKKATKELKSLYGKEHLEAHAKDYSSQLECHPPIYRLVSSSYRHSAEVLSKNKLFSIIYLGILILKDKIQLGDLLRYIREGHVSYHKVNHFLPDEVLGKFTKSHLTRMNIQNSQFKLEHEGIRRMSANVASKITVVKYIPIQNIEELIKRYCDELNLTDEIRMCTITLVSLLKPKFKMWTNDTLVPNYEGRAMAFIIFVLKLLFALDDESEYYLSDLATRINRYRGNSKMFVWKDWMDHIQYRKLIVSRFHFPTHLQSEDKDESSNVSELYLNFMKKYKNKFDDEEETKWTTEQEVLKNVLEKLRKIQNDEKTFPDLQPSLTPFLQYSASILESGAIDGGKYDKDLLKKRFGPASIEYLYSPYIYLQKLHGHVAIGVKHRGVKNDFYLKRRINRASVVQTRTRRETRNVLVEAVKFNEELKKDEDSRKSEVKENLLKEQTTKLFFKIFEEYNLVKFRKNMKKMKKNVSRKGEVISAQVGESSADYSAKGESLSGSSGEEKYLHYNPFERYWLKVEDVAKSNKKDFDSFYKTLPYSFRLVLEECARIVEQSKKELYQEFTNVEIFALFLENKSSGRERPAVFSNDDFKYLKEKVSRLW